MHVAVFIAQFEGYLYPFAEDLLYNKICHWVGSNLNFLLFLSSDHLLRGGLYFQMMM